jgi:hypothetical protein
LSSPRPCGSGARGLTAVVLSLALAAAAGAEQQPGQTLEYPVKAAYLYQFLRFVEWPEDGADLPACVGLIGDDPFRAALDRTIAGKTVAGRVLQVRRFRGVDDLEECPVLFVARSEVSRLKPILAKVAPWRTLTIGENEAFTQSGGMVRFFVEERRVRFEINLPAAQKAGLRLSSRLLALAEVTGQSSAERR